MSKIFKLIDTALPTQSDSIQQPTVTNWKLCMICQEDDEELLTYPSKSKRKDVGSGYSSLADNLIKFSQLGELLFSLERLDEGNGIEMTMINNEAQYHQSCRLKYNNTKLRRAEKRVESKKYSTNVGCTHTRSKCNESSSSSIKAVCFFCGKLPGNSGIHEVATFQVNENVHACAVLLEDTELLAKLSTADMAALEAKYHTKCLVDLYNHTRKAKANRCKGTDESETISRIVFAELVLYIEEVCQHNVERAPVFKLSDLARLYTARMEQIGIKLDMRPHTTRLKQRLLAEFTDIRAQKKGYFISI